MTCFYSCHKPIKEEEKNKVTPPTPYQPDQEKNYKKPLLSTVWEMQMASEEGEVKSKITFTTETKAELKMTYFVQGAEEVNDYALTYLVTDNSKANETDLRITYVKENITDQCKIDWRAETLTIISSTEGNLVFFMKK